MKKIQGRSRWYGTYTDLRKIGRIPVLRHGPGNWKSYEPCFKNIGEKQNSRKLFSFCIAAKNSSLKTLIKLRQGALLLDWHLYFLYNHAGA